MAITCLKAAFSLLNFANSSSSSGSVWDCNDFKAKTQTDKQKSVTKTWASHLTYYCIRNIAVSILPFTNGIYCISSNSRVQWQYFPKNQKTINSNRKMWGQAQATSGIGVWRPCEDSTWQSQGLWSVHQYIGFFSKSIYETDILYLLLNKKQICKVF